MNTRFKFIIAVMAAMAMSTSCQKASFDGTAGSTAEGVRVISVTFDHPTKATIDNLTPKFENNDKIRVSNATKSEECSINVSGGNATFATTLDGELTAIYPTDAAVFSSDDADAPIIDPYFKVPAIQNGKAIIAKATIAAESAIAPFDVQTAVFEIIPPTGATSIRITSLKTIDSGGNRTGTAVPINTDGATDADKLVINAAVLSGGKCYVSIVPGVKLSDLSFDAGGTYGMKGIPTDKLGTHPDEIAANTKYTIDNDNWHPYVEIQMTVNSVVKTYKWATRNVGATADTGTESYGTYFSWGSVAEVYTNLSSDTFTFQSTNPDIDRYTGTWTPGLGFSDCNTPYYSSSAYSNKYTSTDGKTVLDLADDAANANWGGTWRMPTGGNEGEFKALKEATYWNWEDGGYYVYAPQSGDAGKINDEKDSGHNYNKSDALLFFPATGNSQGTSLLGAGNGGFYLSSSVISSNPNYIYYLLISFGYINPADGTQRCYGLPVRPVSD